MSLFDASALPEHSATIAQVNGGIEKLRERLVDEIEWPSLPPFLLSLDSLGVSSGTDTAHPDVC
jgi:hypothetical protein